MDNYFLKEHLKDNPCRGILLGRLKNGKGIQISWLMGRSLEGQNREYFIDQNTLGVKYKSTDIPIEKSYLIEVMSSFEGNHFVGNWNQVKTIRDSFERGNDGKNQDSFFNLMKDFNCAHDEPVFTPRITGYQNTNNLERIFFSVISPKKETLFSWKNKNDLNLNIFKFPSEYKEYSLKVRKGEGYCVTTYMPGSEKLIPFDIAPLKFNLENSLEENMIKIWGFLDSNWKVSIGGKEFSNNWLRYGESINNAKQF
jgi:hypothetical protein